MTPRNNVRDMPARPVGIGHRPIMNDMTTPYIVAGGFSAGQQRVLVGTTDDIETQVDLRTYEVMEHDSTIIKTKKILTTGVLADDMQLAPGATEDEVGSDEYQVYELIMQFCERMIDGLDSPYRDSLDQLLGNSIRYGHGIAETEWEYRLDGFSAAPPDKAQQNSGSTVKSMWQRFGYFFGLGTEAPQATVSDSVLKRPTLTSQQTRLMPSSVKVKPRGAARFVVDDYMNVLGLMPRRRAFNGPTLAWDGIVDRDKFLILTMNKQDEDPRGKSFYRAAVNWYNVKTQMPSEILRLVLEEIVPKAIAVLAENAQPFEIDRDKDNNVIWEDPDTKQVPQMISAAESLRFILENFRSGSGAVIPHGTELRPFKTHTAGTDADLVGSIIKLLDDQMENSILLQTLAQSEGEHQARSASEQVAELLHNLIFWIRWQIGMMTLTDFFEVGVRINFGEWAIRYLPKVSLGDFVRRDWGADLTAVATAYFQGFLDDTQRGELMAWLNLPKPGESRASLAQQDINGEPVQPNSNRPDKQPGNIDRNKGNGTEKKNDTSKPTAGFSISDSLGHHKRRSGFISRHLFSGR